MVGVGAIGRMLMALSLTGRLSMPRAGIDTASRCGTPSSGHELSNRGSTPKLPTVFTGWGSVSTSIFRGVSTDERSRNRFSSGLYAAARLDRVSVRGQPDLSVPATKVGMWRSVGTWGRLVQGIYRLPDSRRLNARASMTAISRLPAPNTSTSKRLRI